MDGFEIVTFVHLSCPVDDMHSGWTFSQLREFYHLMARPHVNSPHKLLGENVAVFQASEMHVFLLHSITSFSLTYREVLFLHIFACAVQPPYVLYIVSETVLVCKWPRDVVSMLQRGKLTCISSHIFVLCFEGASVHV